MRWTVFSYPANRMRKARDINSSSLSRSSSSRTAIMAESRSSAGSARLRASSRAKKASSAPAEILNRAMEVVNPKSDQITRGVREPCRP